MSVKVEKLENNMAKLTIEVEADRLNGAMTKAYQRQKNRISIPGFRKGKVPQQMIEKMYGPEIFYDDAANFLIQEEYPKAYDECDLEIVSSPEVEVVQIEKGKPFIFTAEVALKPEIKLGKYKGVTVTKEDTTVSDEDIEKEIKDELEKNARSIDVTDRAAENGDTVVLDYEGSVDGVPFEGGKADGYSLELGSGSFIPGFEEQLVGKNIDEDVEVNVTFPEEYHAEELAGKPAVFKCKIHKITAKEMPELDDEYVADISEFDTVDAYKEDIKKRLTERKENQVKRAQEDEALAKIIADSEIELPDAMVNTQVDQMINDYARQLSASGLSFDQYLKFTGMTLEQLKSQMRPDAEDRIKGSLVLEEIAKAEKLEASDEDLEEKIKDTAAQYGMDPEELKKNLSDTEKDNMKKDLALELAVKFITDNMKPRAKAAKKEKKEEE
ncbi:MAG: trigger factor [Lachnospiraceae bacterium]|nr:trigger factor [Lachnospiraceae bacterium]